MAPERGADLPPLLAGRLHDLGLPTGQCVRDRLLLLTRSIHHEALRGLATSCEHRDERLDPRPLLLRLVAG